MSNPYEPPAQQATTVNSIGGASERPVTALLFGILNIVFSVLGMLSTIAAIGLIALAASGSFPQFEEQQNLMHPTLRTFSNINMVVGGFLCILLFVSGIGLLKFKPWGRTLANYNSVITLILLAVSTAIFSIYAVLPAVEMLRSGSGIQGPQQAGMIVGAVGGIIGNCFGTIYPVLSLIFLNRRSFRERILGASTASPRRSS